MTGGRIAVFLDRDGTLNEEVNFLRTPDELRLIPGAAAAVRKLNDRDVVTCVISNQSGIARGFLTEDDLGPIHARLDNELSREQAWIDRIYYCPHHPTEGKAPYNITCSCRKPQTGMLQRGEQDFGIDLARSFVVGDRIVDVQVGIAVGATPILVLTGYGTHAIEECAAQDVHPAFVAPSIVEAVDYIVHKLKGESQTND